MAYARTHWHALLLGAALWWATERFVLPRVMGMASAPQSG